MPDGDPRPEISVEPLAPTERLVSRPALRLSEARHGRRPELSTALRLGWRRDRTGDRLLVRFDCRHRGIVATLRQDNADLWTEDVVEAFVAIAEPPARYLEVEVNPLGARFSAIVESPNLRREGMKVEKIELPDFRAQVRVREERWSAVLSIPLLMPFGLAGPVAGLDPLPRSLTGDSFVTTAHNERVQGSRPTPPARPSDRIFRANFFRIDRGSGEFSALFPTYADPPDFHLPEFFGHFRLK